ncbi:thermonuclease family protein [Mucilaginibacter glaciei]|uniref:Thermonuclease family protein n=1 Tax=Mucilaginibacter glaciei TaxID=2772109 RepID=A0A926NR02_9SPHI|nr:thermonuclease family protein [Mucilaginibacter glaciei]MBD1394411.1 thermonuclease family protein [Mucilaginibacter glaciei]
MLKKSFVFCLFLLAITTACNKKETLYKVVKVKDGDTIELLSPDHQNITVRLAEIDAPEKSQAFGQAAKQFTADLCFGKMVKLIGNTKDRYGRTVATIELENGTNVNYEIVKNGYAWQYLAYSHNNVELAGLEQNARESKLGLWHDLNPTPPWSFRRDEKTQRLNKPKVQSTKPKRHYRKRRKKLPEAVSF